MPDDSPDVLPASDPRRAGWRRIVAAILLLGTIATGLAVHVWAPESAASDIAGDALYAVAAYLAVVIVAPRLPIPLVAVIAGGWCTAIELLQLTGIPETVGSAFRPAMLVLGTVFDARDLVIYLVTAVVVACLDAGGRVLRRPRTMQL